MYKITHSLLASWQYATSEDAAEGAYDSFLSTLRGERTEPTEAMLEGRRFEDLVNRIVADTTVNESEEGYLSAREIAMTVYKGQPQVKIEKDIILLGEEYRLVGVLDYLKAGTAYDIKRTSHYEYGKYQDSTQHPMYFRLVPNATYFVYLIFDGSRVLTEDYWRDETEPIDATILQFMDFLRANGLMDVYQEHWSVA
ncbi:MAG TPA: hypothetical protein PLR69_11970 [Candidatus Limiplasma sp.]|nr:hypothetical protein [Candidatus Limiplasma sp.]